MDRDAGSLRVLWVVLSASITVAVFLSLWGVRPLLPTGLPWPGLGAAVFVAGAALRWWAIRHLGRFFTVSVTVANDHRVVDHGPYRLIRHPSYTGILLQLIGLGLSLGTLPALLVIVILPTLAILHRIRIEEAALLAHLGEMYASYAARTRKLVPAVF